MSHRYTKNLDHYRSYQPTSSCYLDGRYFNKVFASYPGLVHKPLKITITRDKNGGLRYTDEMKTTPINNNYPGLMRVVINTPEGRHSNLLIIDYANAKIFRYEPYGTSAPYYNAVNKIIEEYMDQYIDFTLHNIEAPVMDKGNPVCTRQGIKHGFCVAYVVKYGYDYLNGKQYDPSEIRRFATAVELNYGSLGQEGADIEYGLFGGSGSGGNRNATAGVLGGALIGGLIGGAAGGGAGGVLGGAALGGLGGGLLAGGF